MEWEQGSLIKFSFEIYDTSGALYDPTPDPEVSVARKGDGTAFTPTIDHDDVGLFSCEVLGDVTGDWMLSLAVADISSLGIIYSDPQIVKPVVTPAPTVAQIRTELDSNSTKLANLDATVSSRSTLTAAQVWAYTTRTLTAFGFSILSPILVVSPVQVDAGRTIRMARGADYTADSGQPVQFRFSGMSSFAGGSCTLTLPLEDGDDEVIEGDIVGTDTTVFDVPNATTTLMTNGRYSLQVTLENESVLIPVIGGVVIYER